MLRSRSRKFWKGRSRIFYLRLSNLDLKCQRQRCFFGKCSQFNTSRQSAQLWNSESREHHPWSTSMNGEISAMLIQPGVQNVTERLPRQVLLATPTGKRTRARLKPGDAKTSATLVPCWCGANRTIWNCL